MANGENTPESEQIRREEPELPLGAPRRSRAQFDFGQPPIGNATAPYRIIDSEPKHRGGWLVDC